MLFALPWVLGIASSGSHKAHEVAMINDGRALLDWTYLAWVFAGGAALVGLAFWDRPALWQRLILAGLIQGLVVSGVLAPRVFAVMQAPVKEAALLARRLDLPTVVFRTSMPSFSVYRQAITPNRTPRTGELAFLRVDKLDALTRELPDLRLDLVYRRGPVALVWVRDQLRSTGDAQSGGRDGG